MALRSCGECTIISHDRSRAEHFPALQFPSMPCSRARPPDALYNKHIFRPKRLVKHPVQSNHLARRTATNRVRAAAFPNTVSKDTGRGEDGLGDGDQEEAGYRVGRCGGNDGKAGCGRKGSMKGMG